MKIWLLRRRFSSTGGAERFSLRLGEMLMEEGHSVCMVAEEWPGQEGMEMLKIPTHSPAAFAHECRQRLAGKEGVIFSLERTLQQDIYRAGDGVHACWLKRRGMYRSRFKNLFDSLNPRHRSVLSLEKNVFQAAHTRWIIANSQMVRNEILENFSFDEKHIKVIHPGVNLHQFPVVTPVLREEARRRLGLPRDAIVWSFVGSGFARKGLGWAISIAARQKPPVHLMVMGKGGRGKFISQAEKEGMKDRLKFVPAGIWALDLYHAADAFILPTIYDPCSNACLEAAACGLPVITTTGNGASERVTGVILEDPSRLDESAEKCALLARPLVVSDKIQDLRKSLDEIPCWMAIQELILLAAKRNAQK